MIATNVGGVAEIVNSGNGILIPSEDEKALVAAMIQIQEKQYPAQDMHQEAQLKYSPTTIAGLFLEAYHLVLKKDVA
jgi:glycosyltransferase involved in cell wall biosynthesis